jgi:hypothetical protein
MQLSQFRKGCVRKYIFLSTPSFGRPRRIADACGFEHARHDLRLLAANTQVNPGREPIVCTSSCDAAVRISATAAETALRI